MEIRALRHNKWVPLNKVIDQSSQITGYVPTHEDRCRGNMVVVLPYRLYSCEYQFLLCEEVMPCWLGTKKSTRAITGGMKTNDTQDAVLKLAEEVDYIIDPDKLINLQQCHGTESTDTHYHLFSVDLTDKTPQVGERAGKRLKEARTTRWVTTDEIENVQDPMVAITLLRLNTYLSVGLLN